MFELLMQYFKSSHWLNSNHRIFNKQSPRKAVKLQLCSDKIINQPLNNKHNFFYIHNKKSYFLFQLFLFFWSRYLSVSWLWLILLLFFLYKMKTFYDDLKKRMSWFFIVKMHFFLLWNASQFKTAIHRAMYSTQVAGIFLQTNNTRIY